MTLNYTLIEHTLSYYTIQYMYMCTINLIELHYNHVLTLTLNDTLIEHTLSYYTIQYMYMDFHSNYSWLCSTQCDSDINDNLMICNIVYS